MRPMIEYVKSKNTDNELTGVEIGIFRCENTESILRNIPIKKLYLIDPFKRYDGYHDIERVYNLLKSCEQKVSELKTKHGDKIEHVKKLSEKAVNQFQDNFFDFVYIDANHAYDYVMKDLELYYPKVKKGGIIGGHDFDRVHSGVVFASIKFAEKNNLTIAHKYPDWWIIKED